MATKKPAPGSLRAGMSKKTAKTGDTPVGKAVAKKVISTAKGVAKRAKVVGREARDVVTAAGTVAQTRITSPRISKMAGENLKKQVREVGTAIKSGKKGTTSDKTVGWDVVVRKNEAGRKVYKKPYTKGTQR